MEHVIKDAATLAVMLVQTGTGESKVNVIRALLAANPNASAMEAVESMQDAGTVTQATIAKAMQLIETGQYEPRQETRPIAPEQRILQERKTRESDRLVVDALRQLANRAIVPDKTEAREAEEAEVKRKAEEAAKEAKSKPTEAPGPALSETPPANPAPGPQKPKTGK